MKTDLAKKEGEAKATQTRITALETQLASHSAAVSSETVPKTEEADVTAAGMEVQKALNDALVQIEQLKAQIATTPAATAGEAVPEIEALRAQHTEELSKLQSELEQQKASVRKAVDEAVKAAIAKERSEQVARVQNIITTNVDKRLNKELEQARAAAVEEVKAAHAAELQELTAKLESVQRESQSRQELNSKANKTWKDSVANLRKHLVTCHQLLVQHGIAVPPEIQKEVQRGLAQAQRNETAAQNGAAAAPAAAPIVPPVVAPPTPAAAQPPAGLPARPTIVPPTAPAQAAADGQQPTPTGARFARPGRGSAGNPAFAAAVAAAAQSSQTAPATIQQVTVPANGQSPGKKRGREGEEEGELPPQQQGQAPGPKRQRIIRNRAQQQQQQAQQQNQ
ncbi:hypothetical protein CALVIDRAFT_244835 [Calocera viscosa TUFC12733]|uniref:Uncharacterized protein n=1 Tax=Calocera viscosa (strain TUFC12733) TaxID=1330018 RepID=A0A167JGU6_CALVF|nr:hypothetical protein CALVIDRAFT_244835 [Calocera viscosa TUFC12733]